MVLIVDFTKSEAYYTEQCEQAKLSIKLFTGEDAQIVMRQENTQLSDAGEWRCAPVRMAASDVLGFFAGAEHNYIAHDFSPTHQQSRYRCDTDSY